MKQIQLPLTIPIHPYLMDHRFDGKVILPAVEILQCLARSFLEYVPAANVRFMSHASFNRFLFIEPGASCIEAINEIGLYEDGSISSKLITVAKIKGKAIKRAKEHATVYFMEPVSPITEPPANIFAELKVSCFQIPAHRLYAELVPFGPAFQTVQDAVSLSEHFAIARVNAMNYPGASGPLGSPFPLDGALHAACAWCQRFCGIVAFPVGFDERMIVKPIAPGEMIICRVIPVSMNAGVVRFDICLHDLEEGLREMVKGVTMKDVSGGRMTPPAWIRSESSRWVE